MIAAAHDALDRWGAGAGSARLIVGRRPVHADLEHELAEWKAIGRAALFPTGFATNLGVITTFAGAGVLVCSDELNHASIIDGCRLARADVAVYRHRDLEHLAALAPRPRRAPGARRHRHRVLDGRRHRRSRRDSSTSARAKTRCSSSTRRTPCSAPTSTRRPTSSYSASAPCRRRSASLGGFVAGSARSIELVENLARPYIFTTAPTPADTAAALAALRIVRSDRRRPALVRRLRAHVDRLRPGHPSPIVAFVCGEEQRALDAAGRAARRRAPRPRDPAPDGSCGHVAVAGDGLGRAHRRGGRSTCLRALTAVLGVRPGSCERRRCRRHRHRRRQDVRRRRVAANIRATRGRQVVARKPVQSFEPGDTATDARRAWRRAPASTRPRRAPRTAGCRVTDGASHGRRRARSRLRSPSPTSRRRSPPGRRAKRRCWSRPRAVCVPPSPTTATARRSSTIARAGSRRARRRRGTGHDQRRCG